MSVVGDRDCLLSMKANINLITMPYDRMLFSCIYSINIHIHVFVACVSVHKPHNDLQIPCEH